MTREQAEKIVEDANQPLATDAYYYWSDCQWGRWVVYRRLMHGGLKQLYAK